jgi:hypothetical protein
MFEKRPFAQTNFAPTDWGKQKRHGKRRARPSPRFAPIFELPLAILRNFDHIYHFEFESNAI